MKKAFKGFTLIELIVVIAIIGVLAFILVPTMVGFVKDSRIAQMNTNASIVHSAANAAITSTVVHEHSFDPDEIFLGGSDGIAEPTDGGEPVDIHIYLGEDYEGYFGFKLSSGGDGVEVAVWSNRPITADEVKKYTDEEIEQLYYSNPIGCK